MSKMNTKRIALAAVLSLGVSSLALAQTMDNTTNSATNAGSGNNATGSMMGNAPMANTGSTASGSANGTMGSPSTPATAGSGMNSGMANTGTGMNGSMAGMPAGNPSGASQVTNSQGSMVPQPGSGTTVATMSGQAAGNQPLKGSNSFTEKQAERRLTKRGYTNIAGLAKDDSGVWRGTAMNKKSQSVSIALDYKGRITETQ